MLFCCLFSSSSAVTLEYPAPWRSSRIPGVLVLVGFLLAARVCSIVYSFILFFLFHVSFCLQRCWMTGVVDHGVIWTMIRCQATALKFRPGVRPFWSVDWLVEVSLRIYPYLCYFNYGLGDSRLSPLILCGNYSALLFSNRVSFYDGLFGLPPSDIMTTSASCH